MRRFSAAVLLAALALQGCNSNSPSEPAPPQVLAPQPPSAPLSASAVSSSPDDKIIATVTGYPIAITQDDLQGPLMEAYGLQLLVNIVTLDLAKEEARKLGYVCDESDFAAERQKTLDLLRKETEQQSAMETPAGGLAPDPSKTQPYEPTTQETEDLLQKVLDQQHITQTEFRLTLQTDAYLRKIAEPEIRKNITDDKIRERFNAMYGEKIQVRHISCANMLQIRAVQLRLARGDDFATVAREMSINGRTAPLGGKLPPFTRQDPSIPDLFKQIAFGLKIGQVSEPIRIEDTFQLIKLEDRIPPLIVKYDDYKDEIRQKMLDDATRGLMQQYRTFLGGVARTRMNIKDPVLAAQFKDAITSAKVELSKEQQARRWDEVHRRMASTQPAADPDDAAPPGPPQNPPPPATPDSLGGPDQTPPAPTQP